MKKRGQAALEFLSTYGFAFLMILVAIGGLNGLGILDTDRLIPDSCQLASPFTCEGTRYILAEDGLAYILITY